MCWHFYKALQLVDVYLDDIRFLIHHDGIAAAQMEPAFATVRMPDVIELHGAFARALPAVRAMLPG